jgi:hypothetical protein
MRVPVGSPFTFGFAPNRVRVLDPDTHRPTWDLTWPSVEVQLAAPYGVLSVDTGRGP